MQPLRPLAICLLFSAATLLVSCEQPGRQREPDSFPILTPPAPQTPRINGPRVFGVRPGSPFLFQIAATGARPMEFSAAGVPEGLSLDTANGLITGACSAIGEHVVELEARNDAGVAQRQLRIIVGDEIALTPPMGWNSWNAWGGAVTEQKARAAAHVLVTSGLRDHGWSYVNIDDGWQGLRGGEFNAIQPNAKFGDMHALADEVHGAGLKLGLYSSPWRTTFGRHIGSSADHPDGSYDWILAGQHDEFFQYEMPHFYPDLEKHAWLNPLTQRLQKRARTKLTKQMRRFGAESFIAQDARQWTSWGIDYLKYDWTPIDVEHATAMRDQLRAAPRDVVYTVSNNAPFAIAAGLARIANAWRTSVDMKDTWESMSGIGFSRERWAPFNQPGHYNDADMLVLGDVKWARPNKCRLTSDEQYTHMSLWCLLAGPLLLGCDLENLDPFTLGLLTNDEVLEVNQDPLCKQATRVAAEVYAKTMEDGSRAVGLFNRGESPREVTVRWSDLPVNGRQRVRDLWRQKDLGVYADRFQATVAPHGVVLVRVFPAQ